MVYNSIRPWRFEWPRVDGDWMPAGPEWRSHQSDQGVDLRAVTLSSPDPEALAARWAQLLAQPLDTADPLRLPLGRGEVRFASPAAGLEEEFKLTRSTSKGFY